MRSVVAVIVGYAVWTVIWLGGAFVLMAAMPDAIPADPEAHLTDTTALLAVVGLGILCSLVAGWSVRALTPESIRPLAVMSLLLLATGIAVQAMSWEQMPVWYHLTFLMMLVPTCFLGARFVKQR
jgi:hypothetical protein